MKKTAIAAFAAALVILGVLGWALHARSMMPGRSTGMVDSPAKSKQLWTCGMHPQVIQDHPGNCPICHMKLVPLNVQDGRTAGVSENPMRSGPDVQIDPAVVANMGVLTAVARKGELLVSVRAMGTLETPEPAMHDVTLKVTGYIEKLYANTTGMSVSKGQALFDLYSPDIQVAAAELISAQQQLKSLDASADATIRAQAQSMLESSRQKLRLWDIAEQDIDAMSMLSAPPATVPIRSAVSGHIEDKSIVEGSAVSPGIKIMRIEDHSMLWLDAQVFEDQIELVRVGQKVLTTVDSFPGKTFSGSVTFINPHVDHMTRAQIVRSTLDNADHALTPGMYATARIIIHPVKDAILAPRESVIDTGTRQIVFVTDPSMPGHFQPRSVRMGIAGDDGMVQIVEGLAAGDTVVTSGQFLMDVESRTIEAIEKMRSASAPK